VAHYLKKYTHLQTEFGIKCLRNTPTNLFCPLHVSSLRGWPHTINTLRTCKLPLSTFRHSTLQLNQLLSWVAARLSSSSALRIGSSAPRISTPRDFESQSQRAYNTPSPWSLVTWAPTTPESPSPPLPFPYRVVEATIGNHRNTSLYPLCISRLNEWQIFSHVCGNGGGGVKP